MDALEGLILDAEDQGKAATVRRPAEIDDVNLVVADMRFKSVRRPPGPRPLEQPLRSDRR